MVAPHHLATAAGLAILRRGGHAIDAAIAANAVLCVVMPDACGIGGDAFWLIWDESARRQLALNGSGASAAATDADALRAQGLTMIPPRGPASITVPGAVRSWGDAHARFGRLSRDEILAPAIELARSGFAAWDGLIAAVEEAAPEVGAALGRKTGFASVFGPDGHKWRLGERLTFPALAKTLESLATEGFDSFYAGDLAERQATILREAGSAITLDDLRTHHSIWTEPIEITYRGIRVTTHPPNSSGAVALEILNILERCEPPPASAFSRAGVDDARWIHCGVESSKLAMRDRNAYLTDPAFADVRLDLLLSKDRAADLAKSIDPTKASRPESASSRSGGGTVYLAVVDRDGNAVSLIQSLYFRFGSGIVDPITGITYQNRGCYFSLDPAHANALRPGKRTLHTLLPGMLFRDGPGGRPWIVVGSMGGDAQPQVYAQLVSGFVDGHLDVAEALGAPRWFLRPPSHFQPPVEVLAEPRFPPGVLDRLGQMGHAMGPTQAFDERVGHAHAIELVGGGPADPAGTLAAATDPRSAGLPAVW